MASKMERKQFDKPDETRQFKDGKGRLEVVTAVITPLAGAY